MRGGSRTGTLATWMIGAVLSVAAVAAPAWADDRVALVIGNATYEHAPALVTPLNDAAGVGAALERLSFAVLRIDDADQGELRRGLHEFATAASAAQTAVVFYAGHGIAQGGRNFLVPVDARLSSDQDIEFETVPLALVERAVGRTSGVRLIILDASWENAFPVSLQRGEATGPVGPGLAAIEPSAGTLVAFAAKEGTVALVGDGPNSLFSGALLRHLEEPGVAVEHMLSNVRDAVLAATGGTQEPSVYGSLSDRSAPLSPKPASSAEAPAKATSSESGTEDDQLTAELVAAERLFWESIKDSGDPAEFQAYLDQYLGGTFAALARARLKRLGGSTEVVSSDAGSTAEAPASAEAGTETPAGPTEQGAELEPEAVEEALGLQRNHRRLIQTGLAQLGFDPGPVDGVFGQRTRTAIGKWQGSVGKPATGYLDVEAAKTLSRKGTEAPSPNEQRERSKQVAVDILAQALRAAGEIEDHSDRAEVLANIGAVLGEAGDSERATRSFELASVAARRVEVELSRVGALANIAELQAAAGDAAGAAQSIRAAIAVAEREDDVWSRESMLANIAGAQASTGDIRAAVSTAQQIEDEDWRGFALYHIVEAQVSASDVQTALQTANRIEDEFYLSFALASIAEAQASAGDVQMALETARRITDEFSLARALASIAEAQQSADIVQEAVAAAQRIEDEDSRSYALARVAETQVSAGDAQGAYAMVELIEDKGQQASSLATIATAQFEANDDAGAERSIERSLVLIQRIVDEDSRAYALAEVATAQAAVGDTGGAAQTLRRALASAKLVPIGPFERDFVLAVIAYAQAETGDVRAALATVEGINDEMRSATALTRLAAIQLGVELLTY